MIPAEAVEAAMEAYYANGEEPFEAPMRAALEAAAPYMLSHEREQTRLAHLDAMVNRETKANELAQAWDEGYAAGDMPCETVVPCCNCVTCNADLPTNPYRAAAERGGE